MNKDYFEKFVKIAFYFIITVFVVFTLRLYHLHVIRGKHYREMSLSNRVRVITIPAPRGIIYDRKGSPLVKNDPFFSVTLMPVQGSADIEGLSKLLHIEKDTLMEKFQNDKNKHVEPVILKEGLSFEDVARIEARRSDFPGLMIDTNITRHYVYGKTGAHFIGYIGKPNAKQLRMPEYVHITPETFIGQWGMEAFFDKKLRGVPGKKIIEVDAMGKPLRVLDYQLPERGMDVTLSLDIKIQQAAEKSFGKRAGALVALNPNSGEVLALMSLPTFNPNDFIRGIDPEKWDRVNQQAKHPLINRALQGSYPPGSIFKIVVAIAGIEEGVITPDFKVYCNGLMHFGKWSYGCWKKNGHGQVSLKKALIESCDIYFYEAGRRLGVNKIEKYARLFGLGAKTGLGIAPEKEGIIPTSQWKKQTIGDPWFLGETFITAIGQGYISITPVQAAVMASMVANNGLFYPLTVLKNPDIQAPGKRIDIHAETFREIKRALKGVVHHAHGTGWPAKSELVDISGKTGTAQVIKGRIKSEKLEEKFRDHAWFVAFASSSKPEIAVSVFVEHGGHGGSAAAPIAKNVIEAYIEETQ